MTRVIEKTRHVDDSSTGNEYRRTYHFSVIETQSSTLAGTLVRNYYGPVISTPAGVLFAGDIRVTSSAYNQFDVDIDYLRRPSEAGEWSWEMDGTGRTEHISHSLETIASYPANSAPDYENSIGVEDEEIQGTDTIKPAAKLTIRFTHPAGFMTIQYANYLSLLAGYVNSSPWLVWDAGEVRFLGPRCSDGSQTKSEAIYNFEIERNQSNFDVGSVTGIDKKGWHYAWVKSKRTDKTVGGIKYGVKVPQFVYIERVSYEIDFAAAFGIS